MSRKRLATKVADHAQSPPSAAEGAAISQAAERVRSRKPRLETVCEQSSCGHIEALGPKHSDRDGWLARLQDVFGTSGSSFALTQLNKLFAVSRSSDGKVDHVTLNGLLAMIEGAAPENEVQAALALQMALTHHAAHTILLRSLRVDQIPQFESASNSAAKLLRTFAMEVETLAKLQRGGEQVVKVVHVHPGAQAIVGNVVNGQRDARGGVGDEIGNQPHAKGEVPAASLEGLREVRGQDTKREAVPLAFCDR
jgi:hypothetical protein